MQFTKMHGIGNDYVYVDLFREKLSVDPAALAPHISDRHTGVGSDGLILIGPSERADARMRMFNADGSESEMCGNGVRCVAKYIYDHGIATRPELTVETGRGVLTLQVTAGAHGKAEKIRVDMGTPILNGEQIPCQIAGDRVVNVPLADVFPQVIEKFPSACGLDPRMTCLSMGNPHVVLYCDNVAEVPLEVVGPLLENAPIFPRRINVHLVQVHSPQEVTMRTWERGSGITLACGTGACAVAVAGVLTGNTQRKLLAHLPGGDLELEWPTDEASVFMTGPATEVFQGVWPLAS